MESMFQSSIQVGSDEINDYMCYTCTNNEASVYCEDCSKCFCYKCVDIHDQVFSVHTQYGRGHMECWPDSKESIDPLEHCTEHRGEKIRLFCDDHGQLCCDTCYTLIHRKCNNVIAAHNIPIQEDIEEFTTSMQKLHDQLMTHKQHTDVNIKSLEDSYKYILQQILSLREKLNTALDQLEKETRHDLDCLMFSLKMTLQLDRDYCTDLKTDLTGLMNDIKEVNNTSKESLFIAYEKSKCLLKRSYFYLDNNKPNHKEYSLQFVPNYDIEQNLCMLKNLGKVGIQDEAIEVRYNSNESLRIPSDRGTCNVVGICELPSGDIIVSDSWNKRVKLLDHHQQFVSHCDVSEPIWDMVNISPCEVAILLDYANVHEVQFVLVSNRQLVKGRSLQLPHTCRGIAHDRGDLYITSDTALHLYTLTGSLVKTLYKDTSGRNTVWKCALNPSGQRIFVTNRSQHKLLTLARDGTLLNAFADPELRNPDCVRVTSSGQVLVSGYSSHNIMQLDRDGRKKIAVLTTQESGVWRPVSICYSSDRSKVFVGQEHNNDILIINTKWQ